MDLVPNSNEVLSEETRDRCEKIMGEDAAEDCKFKGFSICLGDEVCCQDKPMGRCVPSGTPC